jgi:hypothetical protein
MKKGQLVSVGSGIRRESGEKLLIMSGGVAVALVKVVSVSAVGVMVCKVLGLF